MKYIIHEVLVYALWCVLECVLVRAGLITYASAHSGLLRCMEQPRNVKQIGGSTTVQ